MLAGLQKQRRPRPYLLSCPRLARHWKDVLAAVKGMVGYVMPETIGPVLLGLRLDTMVAMQGGDWALVVQLLVVAKMVNVWH